LISVGVRLAAFNLKQIANLTCTDELDLYSIGEKKVALFCCIPDADTSMNYLVGMIYSNLFQTLYYVADRKYGGRLPIPVHCIMDEWPNVALPDDFDKILATMRSRGISCSIIIQNIAQMKALFKDSYDLKKHVNFRYTEDGGASPYDYAKTPLAHDDLKIDINRLDDYELLSTEDILGE